MAATTWDPNAKAAGITLSGSNLVATAASGTNPGVFATRALSGPSYWEITATAIASTMGVGVASRAWNDANSTLPGNDANNNSLGYLQDGTVRLNGATLATLATYAVGNVVRVAINPQARLAWFAVGAGGWNNDVIANQNPVGNVGGINISSMAWDTLLPVFGASTTTGAGTAAFSSAGWTFTAPSGFSSPDTCNAAGTAAGTTTRDGPARQDPMVGPTKQGHAFLGGYGPLSGSAAVAGTVEQSSTAIAKRVLLFDRVSAEKIGETVSNGGSGDYSIPALGRGKTIVIALDDPSYNALILDEVIPI